MTDQFYIVRDLQATLKYHSLIGIENYPGGENMKKFLDARVVSPALEKIGRSKTEGIVPHSGAGRKRAPVSDRAVVQDGTVQTAARAQKQKAAVLEEIAAEVNDCSRCALSRQRVVAVPGQGTARVRLAIVGDWLGVENPDNLVANTLFGIEQDRMLGKMLSAIKLRPEEVFITNVIKCGILASEQPKAEHARACFSYLQRQLTAMEPEVIFSMGVIATKSLLNRSESLSRLRGRLHSYQLNEGRRVPLIATYHPTFLLQNPEMKRATWVDLQMLARQLGIKLS